MEAFFPKMPTEEVNQISMLGLAHVGDAVYELLVRSRLCTQGHRAVQELHRCTVASVNAPAQAKAAQRILPALTEEEAAVFRRGRNAKVHSVPQHADVSEYHAATGLEALFGWLYLRGETERIRMLFDSAMEEN